jgi:hypothetical protein
MDVQEYIAVFPNKSSLNTFSKISEILMSFHGIKISILKSNLDPEATDILQLVWVKIYGLPAIACKTEVVMKIATLAGELVVVDELIQIKTGPIRVKLNCKDPLKLRGFVKIFFNKIRYHIRFVSERYKDKGQAPPPPSDGYGDDDNGDGEEKGDEFEEDYDTKHKRRLGKKTERN